MNQPVGWLSSESRKVVTCSDSCQLEWKCLPFSTDQRSTCRFLTRVAGNITGAWDENSMWIHTGRVLMVCPTCKFIANLCFIYLHSMLKLWLLWIIGSSSKMTCQGNQVNWNLWKLFPKWSKPGHLWKICNHQVLELLCNKFPFYRNINVLSIYIFVHIDALQMYLYWFNHIYAHSALTNHIESMLTMFVQLIM